MAAEELRRHNLAAVLERLHISGPHSRSELASATGLNRSTVADLIAELSALGLVQEGPAQPPSGPGRPSPVVRIRPEGAVFLAVEISVDSIAASTMSLGGHVLDKVRLERPRGRFSPRETIKDVAALAQPLLSVLPDDHLLAAVGVGVAGVTRRSDGFVHLAPNLGWRDVPLGRLIAEELDSGLPVMVANEADLGALGEHRRGAGVGYQHLIYLSGEVGIGSGIIYQGRPMLGAAGYAGEAGHTIINPGGHRCRCGAMGCWETEAGESALARHAGLSSEVSGLATVGTLLRMVEDGDPRSLAAVGEVGHWLGLGIGNMVNLFNPELVLLGGFYHTLFPHLEEAILEGMRRSSLAAPAGSVRVKQAGLGIDAPLYGAAEMAMQGVIANPAGIAEGAAPGPTAEVLDGRPRPAIQAS